MTVFEALTVKIAEAYYYLNYFEKYGLIEDIEYYRGRYEALEDLAKSSGLDVGAIGRALKQINIEEIEIHE